MREEEEEQLETQVQQKMEEEDKTEKAGKEGLRLGSHGYTSAGWSILTLGIFNEQQV